MADLLDLTLLRHGRSRADDEAVHEGRYDSPLTAVGETQAQKLAAYWLEPRSGAAYSGDRRGGARSGGYTRRCVA